MEEFGFEATSLEILWHCEVQILHHQVWKTFLLVVLRLFSHRSNGNATSAALIRWLNALVLTYDSAAEGRMPGLLHVPTMLTIAVLMSKGKVIRTKTDIKKYRKIILGIRRIPQFSYSDNGIKPPILP